MFSSCSVAPSRPIPAGVDPFPICNMHMAAKDHLHRCQTRCLKHLEGMNIDFMSDLWQFQSCFVVAFMVTIHIIWIHDWNMEIIFQGHFKQSIYGWFMARTPFLFAGSILGTGALLRLLGRRVEGRSLTSHHQWMTISILWTSQSKHTDTIFNIL